ncbi:MAG TPA: hypothetical protein VFV81_05690, partial [Verrucomicrobiae bacterium]|nr:hypothetical protein [Verrucomicrobiae bacterium]
MPIGPVSDSHREISIVEPVSPALERVKVILFRPFDLGKWFTIGFCAWLAGLGESGGSGGGNWNENNFNAGNKNQHFQESFRHAFAEARVYLADNLFWIIPVAAVVLLLALGFWLLILWLNSRGKFMFLHCVALNRAEVAEPWARFEPAGNSLFGFRIVLG